METEQKTLVTYLTSWVEEGTVEDEKRLVEFLSICGLSQQDSEQLVNNLGFVAHSIA